MRAAVDFDSLPQAGLLAQRFDVAHRQATHERADHHRLQRLGPQQLGAARKQRRDERLGRLADLRNLQLELALGGLQPPRPIPISQARRRLRPTLIARAAQPRIELLLDRTVDDQACPELREFGQRLARTLAHADGQQPVDLGLDLRRRRYGTSHGVGLLHCLGGREGTYAVASTAPADLQHLWDAATPTADRSFSSKALVRSMAPVLLVVPQSSSVTAFGSL